MRVCVIYDCLFPHTIGGAERWYRSLSEHLAAGGHEVTYVTLRQWDRHSPPELEGVKLRVVGPQMKLYGTGGHRRILPPVVFGAGVLWHLLRSGRSYDIVHTASFPYFSLLGVAAIRPLHGYRVMVDWHEVWTRAYWKEYLGKLRGSAGWLVQRRCVRAAQKAFCFSRLHSDRLKGEGFRGEVTILGGYGGPLIARPLTCQHPLVVFAGRHTPEKRVPAIVPALAIARSQINGLRATILGDGPERTKVLELVRLSGLTSTIDVPGIVSTEMVDEHIGNAMCLILPSRREGQGLVVIEAASRGTPSVVVADPDNAAVELISDAENGFVASSASPEDLAAAILRVHDAGDRLRQTTSDWFTRNSSRLSLTRSLEVVVDAYRAAQ